jgi:hypothetical protein
MLLRWLLRSIPMFGTWLSQTSVRAIAGAGVDAVIRGPSGLGSDGANVLGQIPSRGSGVEVLC